MTIVAVFLAPLVGLGLVLLLGQVEEWVLPDDEPGPSTGKGAAGGISAAKPGRAKT